MKVIFLDIDGVCNYDLWYRNPERYNLQESDIDPKCINLINNLCNLSNAKIVISSDWRYDKYYKKRLERAGLKNIIGCTPIFQWDYYMQDLDPTRGDEINKWLEHHPKVTKYCIIDDIDDFNNKQKSYFEKINPYYGFTEINLQNCLKILNND